MKAFNEMSEENRRKIVEKLKVAFHARLFEYMEDQQFNGINRFKKHLEGLEGVRCVPLGTDPNKIRSLMNEDSDDSYAFVPTGLHLTAIVVDKEMAEKILVLGLP